MKDKIMSALGALEIPCKEEQAEILENYLALVLERNKVMNLTAITDEDEAVIKHIADSAAILRFADLSGEDVIDIGSGAGFPGVPAAVLGECERVVLLDSLKKRTEFIKEACEKLGIKNVDVVHARAEDKAHDRDFRERFDAALSRAVAAMPVLCEISMPFIKKGGVFLAMKSGLSAPEVESAQSAIKTLGGEVKAEHEYMLPSLGIKNRVIEIEKMSETDKKYPRRFDKIQKNPL